MSLIQKDLILDFLTFATTYNYFWFNHQFYIQEKGVAMEAKFDPQLRANLFITKCEEDVIYACARPELILWARYIDDDVLLWKGSRGSLEQFNFFFIIIILTIVA